MLSSNTKTANPGTSLQGYIEILVIIINVLSTGAWYSHCFFVDIPHQLHAFGINSGSKNDSAAEKIIK